jgi:hypothetical protein
MTQVTLMPAGGKAHSHESYRAGPARMSLVQEYHGGGVTGKAWVLELSGGMRRTAGSTLSAAIRTPSIAVAMFVRKTYFFHNPAWPSRRSSGVSR